MCQFCRNSVQEAKQCDLTVFSPFGTFPHRGVMVQKCADFARYWTSRKVFRTEHLPSVNTKSTQCNFFLTMKAAVSVYNYYLSVFLDCPVMCMILQQHFSTPGTCRSYWYARRFAVWAIICLRNFVEVDLCADKKLQRTDTICLLNLNLLDLTLHSCFIL